ncbi:hypothetical protein QR680_018471 [Steinernema hermaphroditum]|uniref:Uncharacterized protein n=1 Tax=Steinernema hermaphroditum TaxID=289476 RepID=A0AA39HK66_9BILA|nr:hypothetical protein QR680_018471 [Steinernema hermaphroditum]
MTYNDKIHMSLDEIIKQRRGSKRVPKGGQGVSRRGRIEKRLSVEKKSDWDPSRLSGPGSRNIASRITRAGAKQSKRNIIDRLSCVEVPSKRMEPRLFNKPSLEPKERTKPLNKKQLLPKPSKKASNKTDLVRLPPRLQGRVAKQPRKSGNSNELQSVQKSLKSVPLKKVTSVQKRETSQIQKTKEIPQLPKSASKKEDNKKVLLILKDEEKPQKVIQKMKEATDPFLALVTQLCQLTVY